MKGNLIFFLEIVLTLVRVFSFVTGKTSEMFRNYIGTTLVAELLLYGAYLDHSFPLGS